MSGEGNRGELALRSHEWLVAEVERYREAIRKHRQSFGEVPRGFDHHEDRELWAALHPENRDVA